MDHCCISLEDLYLGGAKESTVFHLLQEIKKPGSILCVDILGEVLVCTCVLVSICP